jgi:hypothetical protein
VVLIPGVAVGTGRAVTCHIGANCYGDCSQGRPSQIPTRRELMAWRNRALGPYLPDGVYRRPDGQVPRRGGANRLAPAAATPQLSTSKNGRRLPTAIRTATSSRMGKHAQPTPDEVAQIQDRGGAYL